MKPNKERIITVKFNADKYAGMMWNFRPQQNEVKLYAGETALAFFTAKNPMEKPIDGISTYNVIPFEAGPVCKQTADSYCTSKSVKTCTVGP